MSASPITVSAHYMLEPSSINNIALDNGTNGTIAATTSGTVANTTAAANEILVVGVAIASSSVSVSTVTDTRSLTWHKLSATTASGGVRGEIWWAWEPTAQTHTITVTLSGSSTAVLICGSFSGTQSGLTSMPFDPQALNAATGNATAASSTGNNANPASTLVGFVACLSNPSLTLGASYTTVSSAASTTVVSGGMEYQNVTATALQTFNYTLGSGHPFVMMGFALMSSGNNVQVVSALSTHEFIMKNVFGSGSVAIVKWDGLIPGLVAIQPVTTNLSIQVTQTTFNVVLINVSASSPIDVGYDGIQSI